MTLPYDENDNRIADAWEDANNGKGQSPSVDADDQPRGDKNNGDGLNVYEECRGFLQDGSYFRTKSDKKDFFICDTIGGKSKRAINRFAALTKLNVYDKLTREELGPSRIINRNRSNDAPHVIDQHGILMKT